MKKTCLLFISVILFALACSKDRSVVLNNPEPVDLGIKGKTFADAPANLITKLANQPERKTIKGASDLPFTGKQGTKVWLYNQDLELPNGGAVSYPIDIELLEVFTPKDMILNQVSTRSYPYLLTTGGQVRLKAFKGGKELIMKSPNSTVIDIPANGGTDPSMKLFYGIENGVFVENWVVDSTERYFAIQKASYSVFPSRFGWVNIDKLANPSGITTSMIFASEYPTIDKIFIYLYFPQLKSIIYSYTNPWPNMPVGAPVKVIALGLTDKDEWYYYLEETTIKDNHYILIKLKSSTKTDIMALLEKL